MNFREAFKAVADRAYADGDITLGQRMGAGLILHPITGLFGIRLNRIKKNVITQMVELKDAALARGDITDAQYALIDRAAMEDEEFDWEAFLTALMEFLMIILPLIFG